MVRNPRPPPNLDAVGGHLLAGTLPKSWIPPTHVLEVRALVRLYVDLLGEYIGWRQRLQATLFHHGVPVTSRLTPDLLTASTCHRPAGTR